jgi:hypothetical protein
MKKESKPKKKTTRTRIMRRNLKEINRHNQKKLDEKTKNQL